MDRLERSLFAIRSKADELRTAFGDEARARAMEWAASEIEEALRDRADERLTVAEASLRSGYSQDHLARLVRAGRIPNAGRRGSPRIRAGDLPVRPASPHEIVVGDRCRIYDPGADARAIGSRR
jgi:hypothetical protein